MDEAIYEPLALVVGKSAACREEPVLEVPDGCLSTFEAGEIVLTHEHHFDYDDDFLCFVLQRQEPLFHQFSVFVEGLRSVATKDLDHFRRQLEGCLLEFDSFARSVREEKSEVNVHDVPLDIDENVSVVSVLDLEDVAQEGIGCKRLHKVVSGLFEGFCFCAAELLFKVVYDLRVATHRLFDAVDAQGVVGKLHETASWASCKDLVRFHPEVEFLCFEDLVKLTDELHREGLLPNIVVRFHDDPHNLPGVQTTERRALFYPSFLLLTSLCEDFSLLSSFFISISCSLLHDC